ncbi:hypothetical protein ACVWZV_002215 [Bradyrhizobium sp. GM5.1]
MVGATEVPIVPTDVVERGLESQERPLFDTADGWIHEGEYAFFPDSGMYITDISGDCKGTGICPMSKKAPTDMTEIHVVGKWYDTTLLGNDGLITKINGTVQDHLNIGAYSRTVNKLKPLINAKADAAPSYVAASNVDRNPGASTSDSFTYTLGAGSNTMVLMIDSICAVTSATYNGTSLTTQMNAQNQCSSSNGYLVTSVSSGTFVNNYSSCGNHYYVATIQDTSGVRDVNAGTFLTGTPTSITQAYTAAEATELTVSQVCWNSGTGPTTISAGNSATLISHLGDSWTDYLASAWSASTTVNVSGVAKWTAAAGTPAAVDMWTMTFKAASAAAAVVFPDDTQTFQ